MSRPYRGRGINYGVLFGPIYVYPEITFASKNNGIIANQRLGGLASMPARQVGSKKGRQSRPRI